MLIDCRTCVARDIACHDCVVTVLLSTPPLTGGRPGRPARASADLIDDASVAAVGGPSGVPVEIDDAAREAIAHLAGAGLVPPLRLVSALPEREQDIA